MYRYFFKFLFNYLYTVSFDRSFGVFLSYIIIPCSYSFNLRVQTEIFFQLFSPSFTSIIIVHFKIKIFSNIIELHFLSPLFCYLVFKYTRCYHHFKVEIVTYIIITLERCTNYFRTVILTQHLLLKLISPFSKCSLIILKM